MNLEKEINNLLKEDFYNITDITYKELSKNLEFIKLRNNINNLIDKYPNVNDVCCEGIIRELSKEEIDILIKYLKYKKEEDELYEEQLLYTGIKLAYIIFKKSGMLKEES